MHSAETTDRGHSIWDISLVLLTLAGAFAIFNATLNHDVAWFLYGAERMLDGAKLYRDIIEVNPPLAFYLKLPVVIVARLFSLPVIPTFKAYIVLLICISLLACRLLIDRAFGEFSNWLRGFFLLVYAFVLFTPGQYGQREHLMLLLVMPYILSAIARVRGEAVSRGWGLVIGLCAGIGLAFKPYFLLLWIGIELYMAANAGWRVLLRSENLGIITVHVLYALSIVLLTPEYIVLARQWVGVYSGYERPFNMVLLTPGVVLWYITVAVFLVVRGVAGRSVSLSVLFIAATALEIAAIIQRKGWGYHFYPGNMLCLLLIVVALWKLGEHMAKGRIRGIRAGSAGMVLAVAAGIVIAGAKFYQGYDRKPNESEMGLLSLVQENAGRGYLMVLSTDVGRAFPLVNYSTMRWGMRYNSLWLLPGLYADSSTDSNGVVRYRERSEMDAMEREFVDDVLKDIESHPPSLLIIDQDSDMQGFPHRRFDLLGYFRQDERFRRMLSSYDSVTTYDAQLILQRRDH